MVLCCADFHVVYLKEIKTEDIAKWTTDPGIDYFNQIDNFWNVVYQMGQFGVCVCM